MFEDKTVLVTGGTGSFGRCILKELLKTSVSEVRVFSRDEEKQLDVSREVNDPRVKFFLGDVRDFDRVLEVCRGVDIVYHAAAQKIIDSCEAHPGEALKTNVLGTWNVKRASLQCGVDRGILLSTDKAVKPVNFYGMTKAMAEKLWTQREEGSLTRFMVIRYGNVIGSRGSVVPYFRQLIKEGKPLPITHRDMTRFLITLGQAVKLVLYATEDGSDGAVYVPDLPACKIMDLAKTMGGDEYPINFVGIRQGEKIHECLIHEHEITRTENHDGYFVIRPNAIDALQALTGEYTSDTTRLLDREGIFALLKEEGWA